MKAARKLEAVELMVASNAIPVAHEESLLKATPPEQRADVQPPERDNKTAPMEQLVKLEKEMSQVAATYKQRLALRRKCWIGGKLSRKCFSAAPN